MFNCRAGSREKTTFESKRNLRESNRLLLTTWAPLHEGKHVFSSRLSSHPPFLASQRDGMHRRLHSQFFNPDFLLTRLLDVLLSCLNVTLPVSECLRETMQLPPLPPPPAPRLPSPIPSLSPPPPRPAWPPSNWIFPLLLWTPNPTVRCRLVGSSPSVN